MKKVIVIGLVVLLILLVIPSTVAANETTTSEDYIPSETITTYEEPKILLEVKDRGERVDSEDLIVLNNCIEKSKALMDSAHNMAEGARALGYEEEHPVILLAKDEWQLAHADYLFYTEKYNTIKKAQEEAMLATKAAEYPVATELWKYFHEQGYNDYITAGLLGNFMAEVGGQTLNIQYWLNGNGYYGMAQWSKKYFPGVIGEDLQGQCEFLMGNIEETFNTYGRLYKSGFTYEDWLQMDNEQEAALAFAKVYERCGSGSYNIRQKNATKALEYFMSAPTDNAQ